MIGDGVSPLTIDSHETECPARSFACSWCPFRDYCEKMDNFRNKMEKKDEKRMVVSLVESFEMWSS